MNGHGGGPGPSLAVTLYRGSAVFLAISGFGSAMSFGVHLLMARLLGAESYGYFGYATSWMLILLLGCSAGLKPTTVRFVAAYKARGEWSALRGLLRCSTGWTIAASAAVTMLWGIALWLWRPRLDELGTTLALMALAMPLVALAELWSAAVRGLGAIARSQYPSSIVQHVLMGMALVVVVAVAGSNDGAATAAIAYLFAAIGAMAAARLLLRLELPGTVLTSPPRHARGEWLQVAGSNLLISLAQAVRVPLIVVIAGASVDVQQLAYYVAAQRLANVASLGLLGISAFASPLIVLSANSVPLSGTILGARMLLSVAVRSYVPLPTNGESGATTPTPPSGVLKLMPVSGSVWLHPSPLAAVHVAENCCRDDCGSIKLALVSE